MTDMVINYNYKFKFAFSFPFERSLTFTAACSLSNLPITHSYAQLRKLHIWEDKHPRGRSSV